MWVGGYLSNSSCNIHHRIHALDHQRHGQDHSHRFVTHSRLPRTSDSCSNRIRCILRHNLGHTLPRFPWLSLFECLHSSSSLVDYPSIPPVSRAYLHDRRRKIRTLRKRHACNSGSEWSFSDSETTFRSRTSVLITLVGPIDMRDPIQCCPMKMPRRLR